MSSYAGLILGRFEIPSLRITIFALALTGFLALAAARNIEAQQPSASSTPVADIGIVKTLSDDTRYRIGPGDVITISVRKAPELSGSFRVDQRGMIRLPMIPDEVRAACQTEGELAAQITHLYLEYKQNPSVEVFISDFQSRPVAVIGSVNTPGQFRMQRRVRLAELLTFAGGPSGSAGRNINIIHTGERNICSTDIPAGKTTSSDGKAGDIASAFEVYKLYDTLNGKPEANPFVQPGDLIRIPEADQIFVLGHVNSPGPIYLRDKTITISRAIAMAGGPARDGKTSSIKIIRQIADGDKKQEIVVDLKAIRKQKAEDIVLVSNDVVEVGASASKTMLNILQGTVPAAISQGAIRVIP